MNTNRHTVAGGVLFALLAFAPCASHGQGYPLGQAAVVAGGGGSSSNGTLYLNDTVGETFVGVTTSPGYRNPTGFWYMVDGIHIGPTSAVAITNFEATADVHGVRLRWRVGAADGLEGFNVYRSRAPRGAFERLNQALVAPFGDDPGYEFLDRRVRPGREYAYRLGAIDRDGESFSAIATVRTPPGELTLFQNYPNPFNPTTTISFYLPRPARATLTIYNVRGQRVRRLVDAAMGFGLHEVVWDGRDDRGSPTGTGVYFYRLRAGSRVFTKKLTILK